MHATLPLLHALDFPALSGRLQTRPVSLTDPYTQGYFVARALTSVHRATLQRLTLAAMVCKRVGR